MGVALVLAGGLLRRLSAAYQGKESGLLRTTGLLALILGVAVACGPWWGGLVLFAALLPMTLSELRQKELATTVLPLLGNTLPTWGLETLAIGAALVAIAAVRSVKGLIPLG
jgi:hypothetical protein